MELGGATGAPQQPQQQTGPAGRKRLPNRDRPAAPEDDALQQIARQAEARLAAKRAARAEAREIRMKELERQQKEKYCGLDAKFGDIEQWMEDTERYSRKSRRHTSVSDEDERMSVGSRGSLRVEERPDKDFERGVRTVSSLSAVTLASLGGTSSRRGSGDTSISVDTEASIREIKDSLAEVEEKYKKAMVSNAQLDNEKTNFMYQVDALKDALLELEEQLAESRRQYEEKNKDFEREKHAHSILQFQFMEVKEVLKQREELLAKHGIIPNTEIATNGEICDRLSGSSTMVPVSSHAVKVAEDGTLGRAIEMEMKNESVENVRKREILPNTGNEEMEMGQECLDTKTLHTVGKVEEITGGQAVSALSLSSGLQEPANKHVPRIVCDFKNSDVAELRDEGGLLGNITEGKEANNGNVTFGNVVNKIDKQNNITDPCIEASLETNIVSGILSEEQNRENQKDILVDEAGTGEGEEFEGALDSGTRNPTAAPSQSEEPLKPAGEALAGATSVSCTAKSPPEAGETREDKAVERDLESQAAEGEGSFEIADEVEWDKKGTDKTKERNETENAFLQQETKVITSAVERMKTPCACETAQAVLVEEEKQLEPQAMSLQHDLLVEEEQKEQETKESENNTGKSHSEKTKEREAFLGIMGADSEKSDSTKYRERKPEFIPDGKTLAHNSSEQRRSAEGHKEDHPAPVRYEPTGEQSTEEQVEIVQEPAVVANTENAEKAAEGEKEDENPRKAEELHNPAQVRYEPTGEQSTEEQVEIVQEPAVVANTENAEKAAEGEKEDENPRKAEELHNPAQVRYEPTGEQSTEEQVEIVQEPAVVAITEDAEKAAEGEKEDENPRKAEEMHDIVPDIQESQNTDFSIQEEEPESEDEEAGEEYHEAIDFDEFPSTELNTFERNVSQGNEEEKNKQTGEKGGATEGAVQNVLREDCDSEYKDEEQVAEDNSKEQTNQSSAEKEIEARILTEGGENIQEEKQKEFGKAECLQIDSSVSAKAPDEVLCNTNGKLLDENNTKETAECTSEQLGKLGRVVDESQEEIQVSKKGKGKSREDCVVA